MKTQLKQQIETTLKENNITLCDFANYIDVSKEQLMGDLEPDTLDIRTLEQICKALKIPMYSWYGEMTDSCATSTYYNAIKLRQDINLNEMIAELLINKHISLSEFADYINVPEEELVKYPKTGQISVRTVEQLSKEFRIPLYPLLKKINNN
ncbi:MAG: hypothetical protein HYU69_00250 [Bacteroidetes bacterium]|nr:hypothetical protein [Bacteroidota bacterium]